jgi:pilus assembly protein CpaE
LARSDLILLVVELSVFSLHQARRQLEMLAQQGIAEAPIHVVVNRVEKKLFKPIDVSDVRRALRRNVSFTVAEDDETFNSALDQGLLLADINPRSRVTKDLKKMAESLTTTLAEAA